MFGLADTSRYWYLKVREELCKLGARTSQFDQGLFTFRNQTEIVGIVILFVDDIICAGKPHFTNIINKFKNTFHVGTENSHAFTYVGINIKQNEDISITIDQQSYKNNINIPLNRKQVSKPERKLTENEKSLSRSAIKQVNWLANISRPEISFHVSHISSKIVDATISDIKETSKIIKFLKENKNHITFPSLHLESTKIVMFSDASFNNLSDGYSQGGDIVFIADKFNMSCPISWKSTKVRRVAKSTLAAETLAFTEGADTSCFINQLGEELSLIPPTSQITTYTDNKFLHDSANTTSQISDRRLRVEMSIVREIKERGEIDLQWINKKRHCRLSDQEGSIMY